MDLAQRAGERGILFSEVLWKRRTEDEARHRRDDTSQNRDCQVIQVNCQDWDALSVFRV